MNQVENTKKEEKREGVVRFKKPYIFEGQEHTEIDLNPVKDVTAEALIEADKIFTSNGNFTTLPEMNLAYCLIVAANCTGKPHEFFTGLPGSDALKVKNTVMGFLNN